MTGGAPDSSPAASMTTIYTIGHSTRSGDEFLSLLQAHEIRTLADVRRFPGSRRNPQFSREALLAATPEIGTAYTHLPALGGRRQTRPDSPNTALRNDSFRGYADHMATAEFMDGISTLLVLEAPVAIMCAEAVPWRCHRNMISDELRRRGIGVVHILSSTSVKQHQISPLARDMGDHLQYPTQKEQTTLGF